MNTKRLLSIVTMLIITASLLLAAGAPAKQNNPVERSLGAWSVDTSTSSFASDGTIRDQAVDSAIVLAHE